MADISGEIKKFQTAVYGEEVRGAMVDLCEKVNHETEAGTSTIEKYENAESTRVSAESKRASAESARVSAESKRVSAESARVSEFNKMSTSLKVTLSDSGSTTDYAKIYTISQGGTEIGKINIPKDLVVESGSVVKNPTSALTGTYIKLVIANQTEPIYINVADLCDAYTGGSTSTVNVSISDTNKVTATLVSGSISKSLLSSDVQTTLNQVATNTTNIATNTTNIATNTANIATNTANIAKTLVYRANVATSGETATLDAMINGSSYKSGFYVNNGKKITISCTDETTPINNTADWGVLIFFAEAFGGVQMYISGDGRLFTRTREGSPLTWGKWRKCYAS